MQPTLYSDDAHPDFRLVSAKPTLHVGSPPPPEECDRWSLTVYRHEVARAGNSDPPEEPNPRPLTVCEKLVELGRWSLDGLRSEFAPREICKALFCVAGWRSDGLTWRGAAAGDVLAAIGVGRDDGGYAALASWDGYQATVPIAELFNDHALFAYATAGGDFEPTDGGPLRAVLPHLLGWKSVKWLTRITLFQEPIPGFWEQRGYHLRGRIAGEAGKEWGTAWSDALAEVEGSDERINTAPADPPEVILITADWDDGASRGLAECARVFYAEMRKAGWPCRVIGPCAAHREYVLAVLEESGPKNPVFFFLHGRKPTTSGAGEYRLLGQQRSESESPENVLLTRSEARRYLAGRVVYGASCFSAEVLADAGATGIRFTGALRIFLKKNRVFHHPDRWRCFRDPLVEGARSLLNGHSPGEAAEAMRVRFRALVRQELDNIVDESERALFSLFIIAMNIQFLKSLTAI